MLASSKGWDVLEISSASAAFVRGLSAVSSRRGWNGLNQDLAGDFGIQRQRGLVDLHDTGGSSLDEGDLRAEFQSEHGERVVARRPVGAEAYDPCPLSGLQVLQCLCVASLLWALDGFSPQQSAQPGDAAGRFRKLVRTAGAAYQVAQRAQGTSVLAQCISPVEFEPTEWARQKLRNHSPRWLTIPPTRNANGKMKLAMLQAIF